jgi:hypothetical protein
MLDLFHIRFRALAVIPYGAAGKVTSVSHPLLIVSKKAA